ncbi:hypothetical protein EST38_g7510 [Candolleomyces aberdarensis]|uniref:DUF6533 domain-containing protein n=1 Tax=Candolleomyces aberdarensis TaxID=2316362 RepID=A0A4Q2DEZ3_9AGAR|nr:hypothetical protein EST38_g7510 [Candolleomyces aberdarensis]
MQEEMDVVWPQKWTFGKLLYCVTRYGSLIWYSIVTISTNRLYFVVDIKVCQGLRILDLVIYGITRHSIELSISLCVYALLGATRPWLIFLIVSYTSFAAPGQATSMIYEATQQGLSESGFVNDTFL